MSISSFFDNLFPKKSSKKKSSKKKSSSVMNPTLSNNPRKHFKGTKKVFRDYEYFKDAKSKEKYIINYASMFCTIIIIFLFLLAYYNRNNITLKIC